MSTSKETILEVADLHALAIHCGGCQTEVLLKMSNARQAPEKCPSCGVIFDRLLREAIQNFMASCAALNDRAQVITLRIKHGSGASPDPAA